MKFQGLTKSGSEYLAKCLAESIPVTFSKVKIGDGILQNGDNPYEFLAIKKIKKEMEISTKDQSGENVRLGIQVSNDNLKEGFYPREIGIFVDDDGHDKLYWYINDGNECSYLPPAATAPVKFKIGVNLMASSSGSVVVNWTGKDMFVDREYLEKRLHEKASRENLGRIKVGETLEINDGGCLNVATPVKRYSVLFEGSNPKGTRMHDAIGLKSGVGTDTETCINDFDSVSFFDTRIVKGYHDIFGKFHITSIKNEPLFSSDENSEFYERKPFYCKYDFDGLVSVCATKIDGYELAPMFSNPTDFVYIARFFTSLVDGIPVSKAGYFPHFNSLNGHMSDALKYNKNAHTETLKIRISEYILQLVEFATKDLQTVMAGTTTLVWNESCKAIKKVVEGNSITLTAAQASEFRVGQTVGIGTALNDDSICKDRVITKVNTEEVIFDGSPVNINIGDIIWNKPWKTGTTANVKASSGSPKNNLSGKYPCVWRGKESPWGEGYSALCDIAISRTGTEDNYAYTPYILDDLKKYSGTITENYTKIDYNLATEDGYITKMGKDERFPWVSLPTETKGSSKTFFSDYYWHPRYEASAVFSGGNWTSGSQAGAVCFTCTYQPSNSIVYRLARLCITGGF